MPRAKRTKPALSDYGMRQIEKAGFPIGKALTLRISKQLSYQQIAELLHVKKVDIQRGLRPLLGLMENHELLAGFRDHEVDFMDSVRLLAMQGMHEQLSDPARRKSMDMLRLNTLYGTLYDKQRLGRGESTVNIHQLTSIISAAHKPKPSIPSDTQPTA